MTVTAREPSAGRPQESISRPSPVADRERRAAAETARVLSTELAARINGEVRFDRVSRMLYSTDASNYQIEPIGVVVPKTMDDVLATIELASSHGVPLLPRGGGSSLAGQTVGAALVIDFSKHLSRVQGGERFGHCDGVHFFQFGSVVVVDDFNLLGAFLGPYKADPILIVDPDGMLSGAVLLQRMQPVARRNLQIIQRRSAVKIAEFASCSRKDIHRKPFQAHAVKYGFRFRIPERPNHPRYVSMNDTEVKCDVSTNDTKNPA